jgi:proteasome lid subunit RPN8/RPN11
MTEPHKLDVPKAILLELMKAARAANPIEACGLLAGIEGRVTKFYPMTNADASPEHFSLIPAEQFAAVKDMRKDGLQLLAIWHSHPASPPRMSAEDIRLAYTPDVVYAILSLAVPAEESLRAYRINNGASEPVQLVVHEMSED